MPTEADTCRTYVVPKLYAAGWRDDQIAEQRTFTDGRILVEGRVARRGRPKRADYLLYYQSSYPLAVIEAKAAYKSAGDGMQQAKAYAETLGLLFAYATNGLNILEFDFSTGLERAYLLGAYLAGADLEAAHLGGAILHAARLAGERLSDKVMQRISKWNVRCPQVLSGANLREAFMDEETILKDATLLDPVYGSAEVTDIRWGGVNLTVMRWVQVRDGKTFWPRDKSVMLGDERKAREPKTENGKLKTAQTRITEFECAIRANRQLATALRAHGLNEYADRYDFHAQLCQLQLLKLQWSQKGPEYLWSLFLWLTAGFGFRVWRILAAYGVTLVVFSLIFWAAGVHSFQGESGIQSLWDSFLVSLSAIHGRTTFEQLGAWSLAAWVAAIESVIGILIEGIFIAMLIQRFFAR